MISLADWNYHAKACKGRLVPDEDYLVIFFDEAHVAKFLQAMQSINRKLIAQLAVTYKNAQIHVDYIG